MSKAVTMYRAEDGVLFDTAEECAKHESRVKMLPALERLAERANSCDELGVDHALIGVDEIAEFIAKNADDLRAILNSAAPTKRRGRAKKAA